jgi:hypothetical protein
MASLIQVKIRLGASMKRLSIFRGFILVVFLLQLGCSLFSQYYTDLTGGVDITRSPGFIVSSGIPEFRRSGNAELDSKKMLEDSFVLIGYSAFNASGVIGDKEFAIAQAKEVHASVVIFYSQYRNTVSGSFPITQPEAQQSYSSYYGNVGGSTFSGSGVTTVYGNKTVYMPFSINRYDYLATYWVKKKPPVLGIYPLDLSSEIRQKLQSNKGIVVYAVVRDTPAFRADILDGDILKRINETEIMDAKHFSEIIGNFAGKSVRILILREGKEITKEVQMNELPAEIPDPALLNQDTAHPSPCSRIRC